MIDTDTSVDYVLSTLAEVRDNLTDRQGIDREALDDCIAMIRHDALWVDRYIRALERQGVAHGTIVRLRSAYSIDDILGVLPRMEATR